MTQSRSVLAKMLLQERASSEYFKTDPANTTIVFPDPKKEP